MPGLSLQKAVNTNSFAISYLLFYLKQLFVSLTITGKRSNSPIELGIVIIPLKHPDHAQTMFSSANAPNKQK